MQTIPIAMGNPLTEGQNQNNPIFYINKIISKTSLLILLNFIHGECYFRSILKIILKWDADYADDLALFADKVVEATSLLHSLEKPADSIG